MNLKILGYGSEDLGLNLWVCITRVWLGKVQAVGRKIRCPLDGGGQTVAQGGAGVENDDPAHVGAGGR